MPRSEIGHFADHQASKLLAANKMEHSFWRTQPAGKQVIDLQQLSEWAEKMSDESVNADPFGISGSADILSAMIEIIRISTNDGGTRYYPVEGTPNI